MPAAREGGRPAVGGALRAGSQGDASSALEISLLCFPIG
jgi:hypothetical protein